MPDTPPRPLPAADTLRRAAFELRNPFRRANRLLVIDFEVADPLAEVLEVEADVLDDVHKQAPGVTDAELAAMTPGLLAVARAVLGEEETH